MKDYSNISKTGIIISVFGLIITTINLVYSIIKGNNLSTSIIIFSCMVTILVSNIVIAVSYKTKSEEEKNKN